MTSVESEPVVNQASPPARHASPSLVHSVAWTAASKWTGQLLTSGITLLVARILTPSDYGLVGMAMMFLGLVRFLSDFGLAGVVIVRSEYDRDRLGVLNSFAVVFGAFGCLVTVAAAVPTGRFFNQSSLPLLMVVMSSSFVISGFRVIPMAVLQRDLRFKLLAGLDLGQSVGAALFTLMLAIAGARYWALVIGNLGALVLASVVAMLLCPQRFSRPALRGLLPAMTLSRDLTIANLSWYAYSNADFLVVGKILGQAALGLYNIGWMLAMLIVERVTTIIGGVAPAYLAAAKNDLGELRRYLLRITGSISLITFPISLGLALVADDFCLVVLGPKWIGATAALRLLSLYAGVRSLTPIMPQILVVLGDHRFVARNGMLAAVLMPSAVWLGARWGIAGVALAWVVVFPAIAIPQFTRVCRALKLRPIEYARGIRVPLTSALIMASSVLVFRFLAIGMSPPLRFGISIVVGALAYAGSLYFVFGARVGALVSMLRPRASAA